MNQDCKSFLVRRFGVKGVNITHQSILALYSYNASSGIVVDIGERIDVVPVIDGEWDVYWSFVLGLGAYSMDRRTKLARNLKNILNQRSSANKLRT